MGLLDEVEIKQTDVKQWVVHKKLETQATQLLKTKRPRNRRGSGIKKKQRKERNRQQAIALYKLQKKQLEIDLLNFHRLIS